MSETTLEGDPRTMPTVLITPEALRDVQGPYVQILREAGFEIRYPRNPIFARGLCSDAETLAELADCDASIASGEHYSQSLLQKLPRLRVIARCGVGYDRVDLKAASELKIPVTITPNSNHEAVAELTIALLLSVAKSIVRNDRSVRAGKWPRELLMPVRGKTLGILGLGRIGSSVAYRAQTLGLKIIATELTPNKEFVRVLGVELVDFEQLVARSDIVSIHCPLTEATAGLFQRAVFARMKRGAILLNTSRGRIVVEEDLVEALQSGQLRGAGLDVFDVEPPELSNPLLALENVVCSPHIAGTDELSIESMGVEAATCIVKLFRGEWPDGAVVNKELRPGWCWRS